MLDDLPTLIRDAEALERALAHVRERIEELRALQTPHGRALAEIRAEIRAAKLVTLIVDDREVLLERDAATLWGLEKDTLARKRNRLEPIANNFCNDQGFWCYSLESLAERWAERRNP